jgi:flavin-dependent dehydrogenase
MVLGAHVKRLAETALTFLMRIAIVGGGIAGTSCAQELLKYHQDGTNLQIDLFHQGPVIKVHKLG